MCKALHLACVIQLNAHSNPELDAVPISVLQRSKTQKQEHGSERPRDSPAVTQLGSGSQVFTPGLNHYHIPLETLMSSSEMGKVVTEELQAPVVLKQEVSLRRSWAICSKSVGHRGSCVFKAKYAHPWKLQPCWAEELEVRVVEKLKPKPQGEIISHMQ